MKKNWQIFHLEDQPSKSDYAVISISDKILSCFKTEKIINGKNVSLKSLLESGGHVFGEDDFYWESEDVFNKVEEKKNEKEYFISTQKRRIINKNDPYDYRFPIYYIATTLSNGWSFVESFIEKHNVDIIFLDIKLHEMAKTNTALDRIDRIILEEYLMKLSNSKDVFSTRNLDAFREMGGIIVFGKIMRSLKKIKRKPIVVIQTASTVIDQYSSFEFAFPDDVIVIRKIQNANGGNQTSFYDQIIERRIIKMLEKGEISANKLGVCLIKIMQLLPSEKVEDYNEIINTSLDSTTEGWVFGALFPWIAKEILQCENKKDLLEIIKPIQKFCHQNDWTYELNQFFERLPLRFLTHPHPNNRQTSLEEFFEEEIEWNGKLDELINSGLEENIRKIIFDKTPSFILEAIKDPEKKLSYRPIITFSKYLEKIPFENKTILEHMKVYAEVKNPQNPCLVDKDLCKKTECNAYWLCKLENIKEKFKGDPLTKVLEIINSSKDKFPGIPISIIDKLSIPEEIIGSPNKIEIVKYGNNFQISIANEVKLERCYTAWDLLQELFENIILLTQEKCGKEGKSPEIKFDVQYSPGHKKLLLIIKNNIDFINLQKHFIGIGTFDRCLKSMKFWSKIYICSQKQIRNIFLSDDIESYRELEQSIDGTLYIILLSTEEKVK